MATSVLSKIRQIHLKTYLANERRIRALVSAPRRYDRKDLDAYEQELVLSIPKTWTISTPAELRAAIRHFPVVLVGDYHTLAQSQRGFLRVLRAIRSRKLAICLEFVMARYQRHVNDFLAARINEETFLRRIRYEKSWPSYRVWPNFRPIFDYARLHGLPVIALDCEPDECGTVFSRATFAAWRIAETLREYPRVAVLMGEAHLAPSHLPLALKQALARLGLNKPILTIHQSLDTLYFALMQRGIEDKVDVVKLSEDRYYVPVSSPIAAQSSFLAAVSEEPWLASATDPFTLKREFAAYVREIARLIGLTHRGRLSGVRVFGPDCLADLITELSRVDEETLRVAQMHLEDGDSFYLPEQQLIYLAELTPTHIAEEAAHFLKISEKSGPIPEDPNDFFYSRVLHEAIGYFGSKLFNPKRKPPSLAFLARSDIEALDKQDEGVAPDRLVAALIASWHRRHAGRRTFRRESLNQFIAQTGYAQGLGDLGPEVVRPLVHMLGYELGERLFVAFREGCFSSKDLKRLFRTDFESQGQAFAIFRDLASRLRSIRLPARF